MHILVTNDDGPPSNQSSPYVHSLISALQDAGHLVSVCLPHTQRSWIGKAHMVGATVKPTYFRPGTLHVDDGTTHPRPLSEDEEGEEWVLVDGTPASCVQIGLFHLFRDRPPIDLVLSGPNYGRNTTALFALSSGTIGGAMEGACCGKKAIALSYAFQSRDHDPKIIAEASAHSAKVIAYLVENWASEADLYTVNVPLVAGVASAKIMYTDMLANRWSSSCFDAVDAPEELTAEGADAQELAIRQRGEGTPRNNSGAQTPSRTTHKHFKWAPKFADVYKSVEDNAPGNDGWTVREGMTSVTPLKANFMHSTGFKGEIKLNGGTKQSTDFYALIDYGDQYVQPLLLKALDSTCKDLNYRLISSTAELPNSEAAVLQYRDYESLDFDRLMSGATNSLSNAYVIRKALIRKHYLSTTISNWITKYPNSVLKKHFKPAVDFEIDYAEFLDEALVEAFELHQSFEANTEKKDDEKDWWILKPGMSDRGQGIRLFNSEEQLQSIFEEWDPESDDEEDAESGDEQPGLAQDEGEDDTGIMASQLRHFVAQPYIHPPLLLPSAGNRKFHIRTYVLCVGALKVYVCKEMLALFAEKAYLAPWDEDDGVNDLTRHLTNTCLQEDRNKEGSVKRFWDLESNISAAAESAADWKSTVFDQICDATGEVFEAAARGMMIHFQPLPNAFEVYGLDFLVDADLGVWLLEVNAFPDFLQTGKDLMETVVGGFIQGVFRKAVVPYFNHTSSQEPDDDNMRLVRELDLGRR